MSKKLSATGQQSKQNSESTSPLEALTAFNAVAALAAAHQGPQSVFQSHQNQEQFLASANLAPASSKHLMQFMSSVAPSSAYQRSYLEAFRFYKAAYGANMQNSVGNSNAN